MWFGNFTCGLPAFEFGLFCRKMDEYKATWAHLVPPVALLLAQSESLDKYDLSSLKFVVIAAAPLKVRIISMPYWNISRKYR
jgi:acyl-coenzyme A synthetase/AMP-(fatty) acid ligase